MGMHGASRLSCNAATFPRQWQRVHFRKRAAMSQAIVDPGELRRFAQNLKQFNTELRDRMSALHGQLVNLGDTWRDQEDDKFTQEFDETMHAIAAFAEAVDVHIPFLLRKAERIEEYQQQR